MTPWGRGLVAPGAVTLWGRGLLVPKAVTPGSGPARGLGHSGVGVGGARGGCGAAKGTGMGTGGPGVVSPGPIQCHPPLQGEEGDGSIEAAQPGLLIN